jgi:hypothetical protein
MCKTEVCPCVSCRVAHDKGEPMRLAKWRDTGLYWAPYGRPFTPVTGVTRDKAHLFGPRHAAELRKNPHFIIVKPRLT